MRNAEFLDDRLVPLYDVLCPWSRADDFFVGFAGEHGPARVLDFGCGTGRLALGLADLGHTVTGVDPAAASLAVARAKPGADRVTWLEGDSQVLPAEAFDVAVMTSHVAQFLVDDDVWDRTFADLRRALAPGGRLAFDTRDRTARAWESWNPGARRTVSLPDGHTVEVWTEVTSVTDDLVDFTIHYEFGPGDELTSEATLRFRTEPELRERLTGAGFSVDAIYGGWNREPIGHSDGELLVTASIPD